MQRWIRDWLVHYLEKPVSHYECKAWIDQEGLYRNLCKGDVVLVEGNQRISVVIKYLTQSSWSHAALYIGDELLRRGDAYAEWAQERFGDDAQHLLVEALSEGVVATPISKYFSLNLRVCRPHGLTPEHLDIVLNDAIGAIGWEYDVMNVLDLARYFLPSLLLPERFRPKGARFGSGVRTEVMCSSLLGHLFQKVRFPVLPLVSFPNGFVPPRTRVRGLTPLFRRKEPEAWPMPRYKQRHPTLLTPRDFDLSPYFTIVKYNVLAAAGFDYREIEWEEETPSLTPIPSTLESVGSIDELT